MENVNEKREIPFVYEMRKMYVKNGKTNKYAMRKRFCESKVLAADEAHYI